MMRLVALVAACAVAQAMYAPSTTLLEAVAEVDVDTSKVAPGTAIQAKTEAEAYPGMDCRATHRTICDERYYYQSFGRKDDELTFYGLNFPLTQNGDVDGSYSTDVDGSYARYGKEGFDNMWNDAGTMKESGDYMNGVPRSVPDLENRTKFTGCRWLFGTCVDASSHFNNEASVFDFQKDTVNVNGEDTSLVPDDYDTVITCNDIAGTTTYPAIWFSEMDLQADENWVEIFDTATPTADAIWKHPATEDATANSTAEQDLQKRHTGLGHVVRLGSSSSATIRFKKANSNSTGFVAHWQCLPSVSTTAASNWQDYEKADNDTTKVNRFQYDVGEMVDMCAYEGFTPVASYVEGATYVVEASTCKSENDKCYSKPADSVTGRFHSRSRNAKDCGITATTPSFNRGYANSQRNNVGECVCECFKNYDGDSCEVDCHKDFNEDTGIEYCDECSIKRTCTVGDVEDTTNCALGEAEPWCSATTAGIAEGVTCVVSETSGAAECTRPICKAMYHGVENISTDAVSCQACEKQEGCARHLGYDSADGSYIGGQADTRGGENSSPTHYQHGSCMPAPNDRFLRCEVAAVGKQLTKDGLVISAA